MSHAPAKGTSYNPLMTVSPTHIIRATVGVGFKRGRLRYAYQILRGRDLKTKETTPETRAENFATFGRALDLVLDLNNWHAFINTLAEAGYVCSDQVGSGNALMFCYAFYLIGRYEFGMEPLAVRGLGRRERRRTKRDPGERCQGAAARATPCVAGVPPISGTHRPQGRLPRLGPLDLRVGEESAVTSPRSTMET